MSDACGPRQVSEEGLHVLYRGVGVKTLHTLLQSFTYFYTFAYLRRTVEVRFRALQRQPTCNPTNLTSPLHVAR